MSFVTEINLFNKNTGQGFVHVWHRLTGHAVGSVQNTEKKSNIFTKTLFVRKEERLKRAPRTDLSARPTSGWKALRTTGESSCVEVELQTVAFFRALPHPPKPAPAAADLSTFFGTLDFPITPRTEPL